jgi:hypothetical protein
MLDAVEYVGEEKAAEFLAAAKKAKKANPDAKDANLSDDHRSQTAKQHNLRFTHREQDARRGGSSRGPRQARRHTT